MICSSLPSVYPGRDSSDVTVAVDDDDMGIHLNAHRAHEVLVGIEKHLIVPVGGALLHIGELLGVVGGNRDKLHARLVLPVLVNLRNGLELAETRFAGSVPETDHEGLAIVGECGRVDGFAVDILQLYGRKLCRCCESGADADCCKREKLDDRSHFMFFLRCCFLC